MVTSPENVLQNNIRALNNLKFKTVKEPKNKAKYARLFKF